jgi:hypothetical protein
MVCIASPNMCGATCRQLQGSEGDRSLWLWLAAAARTQDCRQQATCKRRPPTLPASPTPTRPPTCQQVAQHMFCLHLLLVGLLLCGCGH